MVVLAPVLWAAAAAAASPQCATVRDKVLGAGHNIGSGQPSATEGVCCTLCQKHPGCKARTWHPAGSKTFPLMCLLHSEIKSAIGEKGVISGVPTAHMPAPAPPPPPPPLHNYTSAVSAALCHSRTWGPLVPSPFCRNLPRLAASFHRAAGVAAPSGPCWHGGLHPCTVIASCLQEEACAAFDLSTKIDLMHGFGWAGAPTPTPTYGYSRNSGCGSACGRQ